MVAFILCSGTPSYAIGNASHPVSASLQLGCCNDAPRRNEGQVVDACVVDFKAIEGGDDPVGNENLDWTVLALQVQLYATAARDVLGEAIEAGHVHLLKDNQRIEVPIDEGALTAAVRNIEWAVAGIVSEDFPMRPHADKCRRCDFRQLCLMTPQEFSSDARPPPIEVPGDAGQKMVGAFGLFDPDYVPAGDADS